MALRSDIANLEHGAGAQLTLDGEVVLAGVLGAQVRLEFTKKKNRAKQGQIRGLPFGGRDNAAEGIRSLKVRLVYIRSVEKDIRERRTATERRLSAELGKNQFFDRIVEQAPASANAGLTISAEQFPKNAFGEIGTVRQTNARREGFVIGGGHSGGNAFIARDDQTGGFGTGVGTGGIRDAKTFPVGRAVRDSARIDGGILSGPEGLDMPADVGWRRTEFPAQTVVES